MKKSREVSFSIPKGQGASNTGPQDRDKSLSDNIDRNDESDEGGGEWIRRDRGGRNDYVNPVINLGEVADYGSDDHGNDDYYL
jgi:hypothetical protein